MPHDIDVAYITDIDFGGSLTVSNVWCGPNANHICAKFSDESIRCWGRGIRGQRVRRHCHKVKLPSIYPRSTPFPSPFACPQGSGNTKISRCGGRRMMPLAAPAASHTFAEPSACRCCCCMGARVRAVAIGF